MQWLGEEHGWDTRGCQGFGLLNDHGIPGTKSGLVSVHVCVYTHACV